MNRTDRILASAEQHCREQGVRMTPQRRQVMTLLLAQSGPQSAYQLLDQFKAQYQENAQPPTIYRTASGNVIWAPAFAGATII